jgi:subtilisin family serine protease
MNPKSVVWCACVVFGTVDTTPARADLDVRTLARALSTGTAPRDGAGSGFGAGDLSAIIQRPEGDDGAALGLPLIGSHFSAVRAPLADLEALARLHPDWRVTWSAPLHPLLDRAAGWARAPSYRNATGRTGAGVVVGIVDTGIDPEHVDFRNADGTTRIAYLVDFASDPLGKYPEAESLCTSVKLKCAVLAAADIDAANRAGTGGDLPNDSIGHGTHVASLAAGNGGLEKKYVGIAPEATLIVARAVDASSGIGDAGVLSATGLVFYLAEQLGKKQGLERLPAVVNLSLGSDWGPHDGTTALERGLADLLHTRSGDEFPGRAIVVAAGNSAGLFAGSNTFPNPLGVHTDVHVPERSSVRVPLATPPLPTGTGDITATLLVWIAFRPGDDVSVGLDRKTGTWIAAQRPGEGGTFGSKKLAATIANGSFQSLGLGLVDENAAAVVIQGTFARDEQFAIELEGHGTASLWVQSEGSLGPDGGTFGAQFPGATKEATVTIPAASPALIAVGATLNRTSWIDRVGNPQHIDSLGSVRNPPLDSLAYFSSAGPTSDLRLKPDLVAPGAFVAGALSRAADPATNGHSIFAENAFCTPLADCIAVDDTHAITLGTSMASPIVAGAVALLFQGDGTLTESRIRTLLQAGARHPEGLVQQGAQLGAGALDLEGVLDVQTESPISRVPSEKESWLTLGASYAHPDPAFAVPAVLQIRDATGRAAKVDPSALAITVDSGAITTQPESPLPGFVRFAVAANRETGGETMNVQVRYRGALVAEQSLPIAVDVNVVKAGFWARGGCDVAAGHRAPRRASVLGFLGLGALTVALGRRSSRVARTARSRDRTDT